jgi:hypothetical protein
MKELFEGRWPHLLERLDRRPAAQPIADESGADVIKPWSALRELGFQQGRHPMAEPGAVMDQATSVLHEILARPCLGMIWPPGLEPVPMLDAPCEPRGRSPRSILGAAGRARVTVRGQRGRVNGVEDQNVVVQERLDEWTTRLLQTDGHRPAATAEAQRGGPGLKRFRSVLENQGRLLASRDGNQTDILLGV